MVTKMLSEEVPILYLNLNDLPVKISATRLRKLAVWGTQSRQMSDIIDIVTSIIESNTRELDPNHWSPKIVGVPLYDSDYYLFDQTGVR